MGVHVISRPMILPSYVIPWFVHFKLVIENPQPVHPFHLFHPLYPVPLPIIYSCIGPPVLVALAPQHRASSCVSLDAVVRNSLSTALNYARTDGSLPHPTASSAPFKLLIGLRAVRCERDLLSRMDERVLASDVLRGSSSNPVGRRGRSSPFDA